MKMKIFGVRERLDVTCQCVLAVQLYPELHHKQRNQQGEGEDSASLLQ